MFLWKWDALTIPQQDYSIITSCCTRLAAVLTIILVSETWLGSQHAPPGGPSASKLSYKQSPLSSLVDVVSYSYHDCCNNTKTWLYEADSLLINFSWTWTRRWIPDHVYWPLKIPSSDALIHLSLVRQILITNQYSSLQLKKSIEAVRTHGQQEKKNSWNLCIRQLKKTIVCKLKIYETNENLCIFSGPTGCKDIPLINCEDMCHETSLIHA